MNQVKLIIWDLDETFWKGTLSEGEVSDARVELVKKLTRHGIINSICSKNDLDQAKAKLEELGVWDDFVFPVINWNPKGESVKGIIADCQLRAPNVAFIDDNATNRGEVEFYNPEIMTFDSAEAFERELDWCQYKEDNGKRLKQYKLLETKKEYRNECSDNLDFLRKSNIRVQFINDLEPVKERVVEMIGRTNQLNFTKLRVGMAEMDAMLEDDDMECKALRVVDNFGDYGICGFYALKKSENRLIHYLFSCRILNLGVENYVYQKLGYPNLETAPPISAQLVKDQSVSWITEVSELLPSKDENQKEDNGNRIRIAMLGGCDLDQLVHYLNADRFEVIKDFNYTGKLMQTIHREHTIFLKQAGQLSGEEMLEMESLPFLDDKALEYHAFKDEYDYLVFSPLMNYTQEVYRHKSLGFQVAYGGYTDITKKDHLSGFSEKQLSDFKENYVCEGQQSPDAFRQDLEWLLGKVKSQIIFLNGAEVEIDNPKEMGATERHKMMNATLSEFVTAHSNRCKLVDVRKYVRSRSDVEDNLRHYKRVVYIELAKEIIGLCSPNEQVSISRMSILKMQVKSYIVKLKKIVAKMLRR